MVQSKNIDLVTQIQAVSFWAQSFQSIENIYWIYNIYIYTIPLEFVHSSIAYVFLFHFFTQPTYEICNFQKLKGWLLAFVSTS